MNEVIALLPGKIWFLFLLNTQNLYIQNFTKLCQNTSIQLNKNGEKIMHVKCFIWKLLLFCVHPVIHICIRYIFDDCEGSMHCKNKCNTSLVRCEKDNSSNTNFMFVRCLDHSQCLKNVCKWKDAKIIVPSALVQLLYHSSTPVHFWRQ